MLRAASLQNKQQNRVISNLQVNNMDILGSTRCYPVGLHLLGSLLRALRGGGIYPDCLFHQ